MLVRTNLIPKAFDAFTCWPFIFVRPACARDEGLLIHERVHYEEQRKSWVVPWLLRYAVSKRFRFEAELRGYCAQIRCGGIDLDRAAELLSLYGTGVTVADARSALAAALSDA